MPPSIPNDHIGDHSIILNVVSKPANLGLATIILGIVFVIYRILRDPLKNVPGPLLARFTRLWQLRALHKGHFEQVNVALHKKHG